MTNSRRARKRRRQDSPTVFRREDGQHPKRLDLEQVPVYSKDKELVSRLVRVYQTYAGSLSQQEQKEFVDMMHSGDYILHKGGSPPVRAPKHHFYIQMYDISSALWLREEITFVKWALLATLYPCETLYELGKVIADLGLDRRPCFSKYARSHKTTLESLELPNPWQLAKQCTVKIRIISVLELGTVNPIRILPESTPELGPVVASEPSEEPQTEDVNGVPDHMDDSCHVKDASTNTIQIAETLSVQVIQAVVARLERERDADREEMARLGQERDADRKEMAQFKQKTQADVARLERERDADREEMALLRQERDADRKEMAQFKQKTQADVARLERERDADRKEMVRLGQAQTNLERTERLLGRNLDKNTAAIESYRSDTTTSLQRMQKNHQESKL
ncbi:hypothetical protein LEL_00896 [Akanthomyces lecanii RCEF 1005]|uniref:Uncharacterized protein n=1 Tax=Akanthomyces lecanii RCEF 1005 TaxID=1081108 RepID=A0A168K8B1_CORDF|nr:hypothetical protein LEL_00896 [Akanthomyces lecanii RCEF 1005]